jgi:hypothetical protein
MHDTNLFDLFPRQNVEWEQDAEEKVDLLLPKFKNKAIQKWFIKTGKTQFCRIHLDLFGSDVWRFCDGSRSVYEIGQLLQMKHGIQIEPVYERLASFIHILRHYRYIRLEPEKNRLQIVQ